MFCTKCGNANSPNAKFCVKCGNPITPVNGVENRTPQQLQVQQPPVNNQNIPSNYPKTKDSKQMLFMGLGIGFILVGILSVVVFFFAGPSEKFYFNEETPKENNEITQENTTSERTSKYRTIVVADNVYEGMSISTPKEAKDLIKQDSVSQKANCPSEIKKVEEEIIKKYGITAVNLCELDVEFAKEIENVFGTIYKEYPSVRGILTNLTLVNGTMESNYIAAFMPSFMFASSATDSTYPWVMKTQVLLNSSYFLNKERLKSSIDASEKTGYFPKNTSIYSPVAHELGHYLSFLAMMKYHEMNSFLLVDDQNVDAFYSLYNDFGKGDFSLSMIKEAYENYKKDTNTTLSFDDWRGTISQYALAKDNDGNYIYDETVAESFHDVYLNGDKAADASKYVIAVLKKKLEG